MSAVVLSALTPAMQETAIAMHRLGNSVTAKNVGRLIKIAKTHWREVRLAEVGIVRPKWWWTGIRDECQPAADWMIQRNLSLRAVGRMVGVPERSIARWLQGRSGKAEQARVDERIAVAMAGMTGGVK